MTECHISERVKGQCDRCGEWPARLHIPESLYGWYCAKCCPIHGVTAVREANRQSAQTTAVYGELVRRVGG